MFTRKEYVDVIETRKIDVSMSADYANVVYCARSLAQETGFRETDEFMIATVVSELAVNIVRYAQKGYIRISKVYDKKYNRYGLEISAIDKGPGIVDVELAMTEHYSTTKDSLGQGLPSIKRNMDEFQIDSELYKGTAVHVYKWRNYDND